MPFQIGRSEPVEVVDEERGWLWGTKTSNKSDSSSRYTTPGLGVGRYRSKNGRAQSQISIRESHLQPEENDEMKEELLYDDQDQQGAAEEYAHEEEEEEEQRARNGVSYLLGRLKESISSRSKFSSLGSSTGRLGENSGGRGGWNEVGQLVEEEQENEKDIISQYGHHDEDEEEEEDEEKEVGLGHVRFDSHLSRHPGPALSEISLPDLPAFTWDNNSSLKIAKTKRARMPSLEVEIDSSRRPDSCSYHLPMTTTAPTRSTRDSGRSSFVQATNTTTTTHSVQQMISRLESNGSAAHTFTDFPSRQPRRKRREALPPLPPSSSSSHSKTRANKTLGLVKNKSKHLYPGGFVGRSPTKKLRRKEAGEA
jgi:hypothetical protein